MELWTGVLSWWKCHWPDLKSDLTLNIGQSVLVYRFPYFSHTSHHPSQTPCLPWIFLCHSKTDSPFIQDGRKAVRSIPYVSTAYFSSLKHNSIAYRSSKDCMFEIHQLWQWGFSRVYSNSCYTCSLELEVIKISRSSHSMYRNNILNFRESTTILNASTKKVWKLTECTTYICSGIIRCYVVVLFAYILPYWQPECSIHMKNFVLRDIYI